MGAKRYMDMDRLKELDKEAITGAAWSRNQAQNDQRIKSSVGLPASFQFDPLENKPSQTASSV